LIAAIEEFNEKMPSPPLPGWLRKRWEGGRGGWHDARVGPNSLFFDLLQMYRSEAYPLALLLDPRGLTENERDYRMSWLLLTLLGALGVVPPGTGEGGKKGVGEGGGGGAAAAEIWQQVTSSLVFQLVSVGMWEWAVYVLMHAPETPARTRSIRELVGRFGWGCVRGGEEWSFLVDELGLPFEWLEEARATWLRSEGVLFLDEGGREGGEGDDALGHFLAGGKWREASEILMNVVAPRLLNDDRGQHLRVLLGRLFAADGTGAVGGAGAAAAATNRGNRALWAYLDFLENMHRESMSVESFARMEDELVAILPSLVQGGKGADRNSCFAWRGEILGPEEAGTERDMYAVRRREGVREEEEDLVPPPLHAIRNMVLTDIIKKIYSLHRAQVREEAGKEGGWEGRASLFPSKTQVCRLEDMCQDYALHQVSSLTTEFIAANLDGGGVF